MHVFAFRPWVRRAGASILMVSAIVSAVLIFALAVKPSWRFGWAREPFVWAYIGTLWLGGAKVFTGTLRPIVESDDDLIVIRPLHQVFEKRVAWTAVRGTEQSGDRLILYYDTPRGMRFVALNLNLIKGRREFMDMLEGHLQAMGFVAKQVERSRYWSRS
jgi:hypothetical protein